MSLLRDRGIYDFAWAPGSDAIAYSSAAGISLFDLRSGGAEPVVTGHENGVVTIDLAEGDDVHRERMRHELGEPYRTLLGHLRHESGHYFWTVLVEPDLAAVEQFRRLFGDERSDYKAALARHYEQGPPSEWVSHYVSAYATAHPWEDWAETFAHYLHIRDTFQTAASFGMVVTGPAAGNICAPIKRFYGRVDQLLARELGRDEGVVGQGVDDFGMAMQCQAEHA